MQSERSEQGRRTEVHVKDLSESDYGVSVSVEVFLSGRPPLRIDVQDGMFGYKAEATYEGERIWQHDFDAVRSS